MEKSIETIWKEGFAKNDTLITSKFINLYNQKSKHLITRLTNSMHSYNLISIVFAVSFFTMSIAFERTLIGIFILITTTASYMLGKKQLESLKNIDLGTNSYDYLKNFETWWKNTVSKYSKAIRYVLPLFILITILLDFFHLYQNDPIRFQQIINDPVAIYIAFGFLTVIFLSWIFGVSFYKKIIDLIYGKELKKLEVLIADMEELRS